jgi:hypothetical protein
MGLLPPRYSFVLNPYVRERFTKCPRCDAATRVRKIPLVIHLDNPNAPGLVLLNKTCRLCLICETLIVDRAELESVIITTGLSGGGEPEYLVLGTLERRTWRQGLIGNAQLADIREHMADFKKYMKVDVITARREFSPRSAG